MDKIGMMVDNREAAQREQAMIVNTENEAGVVS